MTRDELRRYQLHELRVFLPNGYALQAPLAHWVIAILQTLPQESINKVCARVVQMQGHPPLELARLPLSGAMESHILDRQHRNGSL